MVVDIGAGYDMTSFDPGLFVVSAQMRPGIKAADTQVEVEKELAAMRDTQVGAEELQKAKNLEQAQFVYGQDSVMREAEMLGVYEMLGDYHMVDKYLDGIDKVTAADVQRVAKTYLDASNMTEGVLVPTGVLPHGAGGLSGGELR
jgi:zinc protease